MRGLKSWGKTEGFEKVSDWLRKKASKEVNKAFAEILRKNMPETIKGK